MVLLVLFVLLRKGAVNLDGACGSGEWHMSRADADGDGSTQGTKGGRRKELERWEEGGYTQPRHGCYEGEVVDGGCEW